MATGEATADLQRRTSHRVRRLVGPWIDRIAHALGQEQYRVRATEYVGTVHQPVEDFESTLQRAGFTWDPVSLYHFSPSGAKADGSWAYRPSPLAHRQLHVILFVTSRGRIDVYAHEEYNFLRHPAKHAGQEAIDREAGAERMRRWLDRLDVPYGHRSALARKLALFYERIREDYPGQRVLPG